MLRATSSALSCVVLLLPVCVVPLLPVCIVFLLPVCVVFLLSFIVSRAPPPCVRCVPQPYRRSCSSSPCASRSSRVRCARYSDPVSVSPTPWTQSCLRLLEGSPHHSFHPVVLTQISPLAIQLYPPWPDNLKELLPQIQGCVFILSYCLPKICCSLKLSCLHIDLALTQ